MILVKTKYKTHITKFLAVLKIFKTYLYNLKNCKKKIYLSKKL